VVVWRDPRDPIGKRRESKGGFSSLREAERFQRAKIHEIESGEFVPADEKRIPIGRWVESTLELAQMQPSVRANRLGQWRKWGEPRIGALPLERVNYTVLAQLFGSLDTDEAPPTARYWVWRILRQTFRRAIDAGVLVRNPLKGIPSPDVQPRRVRRHPLELVLAMAEAVPAWWRAAVILAADGGLAQSEVRLLREQNLDWGNSRVYVDEGAKTIRRGGTMMRRTRWVRLSQFTMRELDQHLERFPAQNGYVFTGQSGLPITSQVFDRIWKKARVGVARLFPDASDLHFHDLRHVSGSWAYKTQATKDPLVIGQRLGHRKGSRITEEIYIELEDEDQVPIANLMDQLWTEASSTTSDLKR
jgi:integrase